VLDEQLAGVAVEGHDLLFLAFRPAVGGGVDDPLDETARAAAGSGAGDGAVDPGLGVELGRLETCFQVGSCLAVGTDVLAPQP
jgi:hypothetical protein